MKTSSGSDFLLEIEHFHDVNSVFECIFQHLLYFRLFAKSFTTSVYSTTQNTKIRGSWPSGENYSIKVLQSIQFPSVILVALSQFSNKMSSDMQVSMYGKPHMPCSYNGVLWRNIWWSLSYNCFATRPISTKLGQNVPCVTLFQNCSNYSAPTSKMAARAKNRKTL